MSVYLAVVEPGHERLAVKWLTGHGVVAYAPAQRNWRRAGARKTRHDRPFIEGYVFVWMALGDDEERARVVRCWCVSEVSSLPIDRLRRCSLGGGEREIDPMSWLAAVLVLQSFGAFDRTTPRCRQYRVGEMVRVLQGAFQGYVGRVVAETGGKTEVQIDGRFVRGKIKLDAAGLGDVDPKAA